MPAPDPYGAAQAFLTAFIAAWGDTDGLPLPRIKYVAEGGEVPWDGEQVTVVVGTIRNGLPSAAKQVGPQRAVVFPITVDLTVQVVRQRTAGLSHQGGRQTALPNQPTDVKAGQKAGRELLAVLSCLLAIRVNNSVVSHPTKIAVNGVRPLVQGDLVGVEGTISVLLGHP